VSDDSYGFWRRVRLIPFLRQFRDDADPDLETKLHNELPGILTFLVNGCLQWQKRGLKPPASVKDATETYREESDPLGQFLKERCTVGEGYSVTAKDLYHAYKKWAEEQGYREKEILSVNTFGRRIGEQFVRGKVEQGAFYTGVKLNG
jgi:putative DNA primase/helicase